MAWFDPAIVTRTLILRWLTERLGELAWHKIGRPAENSEEQPAGPAGTGAPPAPALDPVAMPAEAPAYLRAGYARAIDRGEQAGADDAVAEQPGGYGDGLDPAAVFGSVMRAVPPWGLWTIAGRRVSASGTGDALDFAQVLPVSGPGKTDGEGGGRSSAADRPANLPLDPMMPKPLASYATRLPSVAPPPEARL